MSYTNIVLNENEVAKASKAEGSTSIVPLPDQFVYYVLLEEESMTLGSSENLQPPQPHSAPKHQLP